MSVSTGLSPTSTAPPAPSAQRPAHDDSHGARRPASQRPVGVAGDAQRGDRQRRVALHEAQRPARGLQVHRELPVVLAVADEPRREAVVAGRAAVAQRGDGGVGGLHARGRRRRSGRRSSGPRPRRGATGRGRGGRARRASAFGFKHRIAPGDGARTQPLGMGVPGRGHRRGRGAGRGARRRPGAGLRLDRRRGAAADARAAGAAGRRPAARWPPSARPRTATARCHSLGKSYVDTVRAFRGRYEHVVDVVIRPRRRGRRRDRARMGGGRERRGHPLRRRHERRRRRRAARSRPRSTARRRSTSARSTACSRSTRSRARRASAPAPRARGWRSSSAPTG